MKIDFNDKYNQENFVRFLRNKDFLGDFFKEDIRELNINKLNKITKVTKLGELENIDDFDTPIVMEVEHDSIHDPRVTLTKELFKIMDNFDIDGERRKNALVILKSSNSDNYRFSLLTSSYQKDTQKRSNTKRFSFLLGPNERIKTPQKYLIEKGKIKDFQDLESRFDVEVVRKEFFQLYINLFLELYNEIQNEPNFSSWDKYKNFDIVSFTKNLLGKIVFLYFLQKKGWLGIDQKDKAFSQGTKTDFFRENLEQIQQQGKNFYNDFLEHLFYNGLNNSQERNEDLHMKIPYLNGGLFETEYDRANTVINLDNKIFENIIKSFDIYNFTIDEDDPYDREIAVDPEMLGKIFEKMISIRKDNIVEILDIYQKAKQKKKINYPNPDNITNIEIDKTLNKKYGAFYTPREIVHYMTKESLINHLVSQIVKNKSNVDKNQVESKIRQLWEYKDKHFSNEEIEDEIKEGYNILKEYANDIVNNIKNLKILDPAVGSGAFPMGILREIWGILLYLVHTLGVSITYKGNVYKSDSPKLSYIIKKNIIENVVYGVDISPGAIDIARLRFWLSLVVDSQEPFPLPNLDFKFVAANALIPLQKDTLFTDNELIQQLKKIRMEYFDCSDNHRKKELEEEFVKVKHSFFYGGRDKLHELRGKDGRKTKAFKEERENMAKSFTDGKNKQLIEWEPFNTNKSNEWFDPVFMFGVEKFDIVIGNPPYIQLQNNNGELANLYKDLGFETFERRGDIYALFYEKGFDLLKNSGILTFITSNKWMRAGYGKKLRQFFVDNTNPLILIDLGAGIFDTATVDSNILILEKKQVKEFNVLGIDLSKEIQIDDIYKFYDKKVNISDLSKESWIIISEQEQKIKEKIEKNGQYLKDFDVQINKGIMTGCNKAYYISKKQYLEFKSIYDDCDNFIKPLFRGRSVNAYYTFQDCENYVIIINNDFNINYYHKIKEHLYHYKNNLKARVQFKRGDHAWYSIDNCPSKLLLDRFEKPKIIYPNMTSKPVFTLDDSGSVGNDKTFILTGSISMRTLCLILNSKIIEFILRRNCAGLGEGGLELRKIYMQFLPLPKIDFIQSKYISIFENIFNKILEIIKQPGYDPDNTPEEQKKLEKQIDIMIYKLYELTYDEVLIVDPEFDLSREEFERF